MDTNKIDLNKPAFGPGSQTLAEVETREEKPEVKSEVKEEPKEEVKVEETEPEEVSAEKPRVTYSRFENVNKARREAEAEAERLRERISELESSRYAKVEEPSQEMPSWWRENFGDSDASKKGWQNEVERQKYFMQAAREEAVKAIQEEGKRENERVSSNLDEIDSGLESLSSFLGRDLTEKEESDILDIIDEYTPKNGDGNYAGAIIPFDKAWEIREMKNNLSQASKRQSRDKVAAAVSSRTEGETSLEKNESDKGWNPSWSALTETLRRKGLGN